MSESNDPFDHDSFEFKETGNGGPEAEVFLLVELMTMVRSLVERLDKFQEEVMDRLDKLESKDKT